MSARTRRPTSKAYDEAYFRRWYDGRGAIASADDVARRAALALAAAEYLLERRVRTVLDVGCGEGRWRAPLRRMRRGLEYLGVDPSEYAVRRHGRRRNLRLCGFAELDSLRLRRSFDLVVCADVLHYLSAAELERGLRALRGLAGGLVWADAFTTADEFEGDREGWHPRSPRAYRRAFADAGFVPCGLNAWAAPRLRARPTALERCG